MWVILYEEIPLTVFAEDIKTLRSAIERGVRPPLPKTISKDEAHYTQAMTGYSLDKLHSNFDDFSQNIPIEVESLLSKCWSQDPQQRPSIDDLLKEFTQLIKNH
ncbi:hypothetical protein EIN_400740 [Entamoeba invadens IP1]|uniref:Serine-threonine/tyrosine-protein kinase catalytic domain-containing protein n=1 Tax=Entamoeba invadens IP1 TaxID=370355 RepID=A0A0A1UFV7_ENTIV|nr:hypothetical protein EIN_400740 [Entamoeba invadens IP1]ELP91954.1 hypothetical protein EIN_400740 [Entamoeba invadens IP1]|eukprot:XP_004258725.1 hypothetical protein EIN_400740 [Entamoeba invadens IP1]